jgi:hypothetical protein
MESSQPHQLILVCSPRDVRALAREILSGERDYPVIALTARLEERRPSLSVERIRKIVGPSTPIYFISCHELTLRLSHFLPKYLAANGGAGRLWWPGVSRSSRPEDHPRFFDVRGDYQEEVYEWLEAEFRPPLRPPPTLAKTPPLAEAVGYATQSSDRPLSSDRPQTGDALEGAVKILSHFAGAHAMGHTELAQHAGISRSLAHRCLVELASLGYLTETRERCYRLAGHCS